MINFRLKDFDKINPVGQEPNLYLSWFWLTDGELWLQFGNQTIYEYSNEALLHFRNKLTLYSEYYIVRFLEDFTERFDKISISIPDKLYRLTDNLQQFKDKALIWLNTYDTDQEKYSNIHFEAYEKLISWTYERCVSSTHLIGGPQISFFRNKEKIRIVWKTEYALQNGISLWTAKDGHFEMNYADFINEVKKFGQRFFKSMDKQIELALSTDWQNVKVNKIKLVEEQKERKQEFYKNLSLLEQEKNGVLNWTEIEQLCHRIEIEI